MFQELEEVEQIKYRQHAIEKIKHKRVESDCAVVVTGHLSFWFGSTDSQPDPSRSRCLTFSKRSSVALLDVHIDHQPAQRRAIRSAIVGSICRGFRQVLSLIVFVRAVDRENHRFDDGILETPILYLLAKIEPFYDERGLIVTGLIFTPSFAQMAEYFPAVDPLYAQADSRSVAA